MVDRLGPYLLGPNDTPENGIYTGDARELAKTIPDESVDLIFTDPVYQNIDDYRWLAEIAARVLKSTGALLAWSATSYLPEVLRAMIPPMEWAWMLYWQKYGPCYPGKPGLCVIAQCLWLDKGQSKTHRKMADWMGAAFDLSNRHSEHKWSKPERVLGKWVDAFAEHGAIICDPFTGGGTVPAVCKMLGRNYLAFEIDPDVAETARERVRNTQMPLFVLDPQQMTLGGD
jgi:DNA modification methylase